jgi:5'-3' exonuclease
LQTVTGTSNSSSTTVTNNFTVQGVNEETAKKLMEEFNRALEEAEAANG